jgi:solute carrier family 8 (sodium/calcium exchanger)
MELEGMKRCLARLQESSVEIEAVVTDRHKYGTLSL